MDIQFIGNYREQNQGFGGSVYGWGVLSFHQSKGLQRAYIDSC